jgi:hypothetical protein
VYRTTANVQKHGRPCSLSNLHFSVDSGTKLANIVRSFGRSSKFGLVFGLWCCAVGSEIRKIHILRTKFGVWIENNAAVEMLLGHQILKLYNGQTARRFAHDTALA